MCLVDYDPHGIEILSTYKFGSAAMSVSHDHLALHDLKWLGIRSGDFSRHQTGVMDLSRADNEKLKSLLSRFAPSQCNENSAWLSEMMAMKLQQRKAEIEIMYDCVGGLFAYITRTIREGKWI